MTVFRRAGLLGFGTALVLAVSAKAAGGWSCIPPFYGRHVGPEGKADETVVLYPLFTYRSHPYSHSWSLFELINAHGPPSGAAAGVAAGDRGLDIWPFYFSRDTGEPGTTYRAVFPVAGTVRERFWCDQASWVLFPLYLRTERRGTVTTSAPWPFVRVTQGAASGFALWPLFGWRDQPGAYHRAFYLWPLGWNATAEAGPDAPAGTPPLREEGLLPFYSSREGPDVRERNYLWPFFGWTDRSAPVRYRETRYFWPFFVQGRGDQAFRDRWAPFYTHSVVKGYDKTWVLWPLWRRAEWSDDGEIAQTQFAYVLYWCLEQRSLSRPSAPAARRLHVWPLFSYWDNGAGRRQLQVLSPFDVFFPTNDEVRHLWTPLFAFYRQDRSPAAGTHTSLFWGAVAWDRRPEDGRTALRLGSLKLVFSGPRPIVTAARRP